MLDFLILAAHSAPAGTAPTGKGMSAEWGIVILLTVIGIALTLMPPRRTSEVKRPKE